MHTYVNTIQNVKGTTLILNCSLTIEYVPKNKIKAYPKLTGKGILYQAKSGKIAKTAIENF